MADDPAVKLGSVLSDTQAQTYGAEDGDDHSILTNGGGDEPADIDADRAAMGGTNDDKGAGEVNSDEILNLDE